VCQQSDRDSRLLSRSLLLLLAGATAKMAAARLIELYDSKRMTVLLPTVYMTLPKTSNQFFGFL
jgi:hypothetical protein